MHIGLPTPEIKPLSSSVGVTCPPLTDIPRHLLPADVTIGENQAISRPAEWA